MEKAFVALRNSVLGINTPAICTTAMEKECLLTVLDAWDELLENTAMAELVADLDQPPYICHSCHIVPVEKDHTYCDKCCDDLVIWLEKDGLNDWLMEQAVEEMAEQVKLQQSIDKGLY